MRFEFNIPAEWVEVFKYSLPLVLGVQLLCGALFGFYRGWWRYVGMADVVRLVLGLATALLALVGCWYIGSFLGLDPRFFKPPRGVLVVQWGFSLLALFGARVVVRVGRDRFRPSDVPNEATRVVTIGAG